MAPPEFNFLAYTQLRRTLDAGSRAPSGFTLVELLITVAILATLVSTALPGLGAIVDSMKLSSFSSVFLSHLHVARAEAIKRHGRVVLCKSGNGTDCAAEGSWDQGWIVFHDANNNGVLDTGEDVVQRQPALPGNLRLVGNGSVSGYVSFASTGGTATVGGAFQAGTLTMCRQSLQGGEARQIILNAAGRPRMQKFTVGICPLG